MKKRLSKQYINRLKEERLNYLKIYKFYNGCSHDINLYLAESCTFSNGKYHLKQGHTPYYIIPYKNCLNAYKDKSDFAEPFKGLYYFHNYDTFEEGYDFYIVSQMYKEAHFQISGMNNKILVPTDLVYSKNKVVGCISLGRVG